MQSPDLIAEINTISKSKVLSSANLDEIISEIGTRICKCLQVERVNIWLYSEERDFLRSIGEIGDYGTTYKKGSFLFEKNIPAYFSHLKSDEILVINNVNTDPITNELKDSYCAKHNIVSLMDVPLRIEGKMVGVLCFEQTIIPKNWTLEEQRFALSGAQIISLAIETRHRRRVQASLEKELREKNLLIKESHHRIKNNFSILISLLRMRANTPNNLSPKEILEDCINRIFSIMKVHEQLYKTKGYAVVQLEPYIKELAREIQYSTLSISQKLKIEIMIDDINVKSSTAVYLGLFLNEVITNSIKYSFQNVEHPVIKIDVEQIGNTIMFRISDNGNGFNYNEHISDKTIGLALLKDIEKSLNGKLQTPMIGNPNYLLEFYES